MKEPLSPTASSTQNWQRPPRLCTRSTAPAIATQSDTPGSGIGLMLKLSKEEPAPQPKTSKSVGCKKFFPTVGMTLTVPCE